MGLIKATKAAVGGVLADQWKEFFYCDAMPPNVLAVQGKKKVSGRSSNTNGSDNVISDGSIVTLADGQCLMIVSQGRVVEFTDKPGEYTFDAAGEPTIFAGSFGRSVLDTIKSMGQRVAFGGEAPKDHRVYYFNTKELIGNKYGTPNPVPFRVVDQNIGLDVDISIRCFGEYSYRIMNPPLFYKNVCGNFTGIFRRESLDDQLKSELMTALQPAFAKISAMGIRYSALPGHTIELAEALNEILSRKWRETRGLEIGEVGVSSVKASEEDENMIKELQRNATFRNPNMAAAHLVSAQAEAMQAAASNKNAGPAMAFMGMNMAANAGGMNGQNLFQMGQQPQYQQTAPAPAPAAAPEPASDDSWTCSCGAVVKGNFCTQCGSKKPEPKPAADSWTCSCGAVATGKFCSQCGAKRPEAPVGWTCSCGAVNKGKFCSECGAKKPADAPLYRCDKCGWEPEDPKNPPRFCPECGDPFNDEDIR